jgi:hypothetical protein
MAATQEFSKWQQIWLWLARLLIALAIIGWSFYWNYVDQLDRNQAYATPSGQR